MDLLCEIFARLVIYTYMTCLLFVNMLLIFIFYLVNISSVANVTSQVNFIPMLNVTNFKVQKEAIEIVLNCIDLNLKLRVK